MEEKFMLLSFNRNYAISNLGNIINVKSGRLLKTNINPYGYKYVQLSINGIRTTYRIHRLVARAFVDNPDNKPYVNHIDGNKLNNNANNLEWVTAKENDNHARKTGLKNQNKPIKAINIETGEELVFESLSECGRYLKLNTGSIHRVLKNKRTYYNKYKFVYL